MIQNPEMPQDRHDVGVAGAHERAADRRLLLLQHLVQRPVACTTPVQKRPCELDPPGSKPQSCVCMAPSPDS